MPRWKAAPRRTAAAAAVVAFALLAAIIPAAAGPQDRLDDIQRRQDRLDRKIENANQRRGQLLDRIGGVDARRADVEAVVTKLDGDLARLNAHIAKVADRLEEAQQQLALLQSELQQILARLVRRTELFTERAVAAYKAGPTAYLESLLSSKSLGDMIDRYEYYDSAMESDADLLDEIGALRNETEAKRNIVQAKEEAIAADKRALETDRAQVAAVRADRARALASLETVLGSKRHLLAAVESRRSTYDKVQQELESESNQIENLLASSGTPAGPPPSGNGRFVWPAPGPVVSPFGYRTHPIFGDRRLHTGIDIGAPYGATVIAGDAGTVAFAGVMSGYGNVVVVDHGGGLATTYNHLSAFLVSGGQSVGRAQPVGRVGCTGYCTGPHLHFEVRVNGTPVDPMPYLR
jgi:murein DD-endopeptidase MepM/ murein hydrolase activator NlpD